jgi:serine/threonine-protein kinase RsbT
MHRRAVHMSDRAYGETVRAVVAEITETVIATHGDIVAARRAGRDLAAQNGFKPVDCAQIATAISELARNICLYAGSGRLYLRVLEDHGRRGIEIVAEDQGPGIADPELAMRDGYSTSRGLGLGLPGSKRLMDEFELTTAAGVGTTVRTRKWLGR